MYGSAATDTNGWSIYKETKEWEFYPATFCFCLYLWYSQFLHLVHYHQLSLSSINPPTNKHSITTTISYISSLLYFLGSTFHALFSSLFLTSDFFHGVIQHAMIHLTSEIIITIRIRSIELHTLILASRLSVEDKWQV